MLPVLALFIVRFRGGISMAFLNRLKEDIIKHKYKYLIVLPVIIYMILFCYKPMYGILIAFQKYRPTQGGILDGRWVRFQQFSRFFNDIYFWRVFKNTLSISFYDILFSFPSAIMLALLLNEVKVGWFKRSVQTVSYLPHFISMVVICGLIREFTLTDGLINDIIVLFGGERDSLLSRKELYYPIYIISGIWQTVGWNSIIYLAALAGIDQEQYEAAKIDGASRLQQMWYITLPGILPTISTMLVLRLGRVLSIGYEKTLLIYQPLTYEVADIISTYSYRKGLIDADYSYSTAIGLFNSVINIIFLVASNKISKKMGQSGLF